MPSEATIAKLAMEVRRDTPRHIKNSIAFVQKHGNRLEVEEAVELARSGASMKEWTALCIQIRNRLDEGEPQTNYPKNPLHWLYQWIKENRT